jgi:hypothetical protein
MTQRLAFFFVLYSPFFGPQADHTSTPCYSPSPPYAVVATFLVPNESKPSMSQAYKDAITGNRRDEIANQVHARQGNGDVINASAREDRVL